MTTKTRSKPKGPKKAPAAKKTKSMTPAAQKAADAPPKANGKLPPIEPRTALDILDEATHLAVEIDGLIEEENSLSKELRDVQKDRKAKTKTLTSVLRDRQRGQGRLDFPDRPLGNAPAGPAPGHAETAAYVAGLGVHSLRVETRAPGEWTPVLDCKDLTPVAPSAGEAQAIVLDACEKGGFLKKDVTVAWKPDVVKGPPIPMGVEFHAVDGDRKVVLRQTDLDKWEARDEQHRPLAQGLSLQEAQRAAAKELKVKALTWKRFVPNPGSPAPKPEGTEAAKATPTAGEPKAA